MKNLDPLHHISIIESRGTNCAWVRIRYDDKQFQESFPFRRYGSKEAAIAAAIKRRDEEGRRIYGEHWPFTKFSPRKVSPLNSSGEIGVSYSESDHAIAKYGDKKARSMAVQRRRAEVEKNRIAAQG